MSDKVIPENALGFSWLDFDLTVASILDAIDTMEINIANGMHLFVVRAGRAFYSCNFVEITELNKKLDNVLIRLDIWEESDIECEWLITHIESGKCLYCKGA